MGFLATDFVPLATVGPTVLIPSNKDVVVKVFTVSRSDTANTLKAVLPADASILSMKVFGSTASNAGTTAVVNFTVTSNAGTITSGSYNVLSNGAVTGDVTLPGLPNIMPVPLTGDLQISAQYVETGTASTAGGPWNVSVTYVR